MTAELDFLSVPMLRKVQFLNSSQMTLDKFGSFWWKSWENFSRWKGGRCTASTYLYRRLQTAHGCRCDKRLPV